MCGNGTFGFIILFLLTPVIGAIIYAAGKLLPPPPGKDWGANCAGMTFALMLSLGIGIGIDILKANAYNAEFTRLEKNATQFCDLFIANESALYAARTSADPAVQLLKRKLDQLIPGESFEIGSIDRGQREFAFYQASPETKDYVLINELTAQTRNRWIVGRGRESSHSKELVSNNPCVKPIIEELPKNWTPSRPHQYFLPD